MPIVYKEIKRGGMECEIHEHSGAYTVALKYKGERRVHGPFSDEDEATQILMERAEQWIEELTAGRNTKLNGMKMIGRK